jgi:hypothetical protein
MTMKCISEITKAQKTHDKVSKRSITGAEATKQAANRVERAEAQPIVHYENKSDGKESILVPGTPGP